MNSSALTVFYICFMKLLSFSEGHIFSKQKAFPEVIESTNFLVETKNCRILDYIKTMKFYETYKRENACGVRVIFYKRISDTEIVFIIDEELLYKHYMPLFYEKVLRKFFNIDKTSLYKCCYQFVERSKEKLYEDRKVVYSACTPFRNGAKILLKQESIKVTCKQTYIGNKIYEDAYLILKPSQLTNKSTFLNETFQINNDALQKLHNSNFSVLMIGVDTMSRGRLFNSMPQTANYLKNNNWLDFRGYQKVGYNTFPNIMTVLTGMHVQKVNNECSQGMHVCNHLMLWSSFKKAGYITAYGEDYLSCPDTFHKNTGFRTVPTDHYTKPFFLIGEHESGNLICHNHLTSPKHILNYARDFANAYKDNKFFGMFWFNSIGHHSFNLPTLHDNDMTTFFKELNETVKNNTIIIFFSDHGVRFGEQRIQQIESYYEERLPMLFIWTPFKFRKTFKEQYTNLQNNQHRLVTPYDLHLTLNNILGFNKTLIDCPSCTSMFNEVPESRTCKDVNVSDTWCTCYPLKETTFDQEGLVSIQKAVSFIQNIRKRIKTEKCTKCSLQRLEKVYRTHFFKDDERIVYVIAFQMMPGNFTYEANVVKYGNNYKVFANRVYLNDGGTDCLIDKNDKIFCYCEPEKGCKNIIQKYLKIVYCAVFKWIDNYCASN